MCVTHFLSFRIEMWAKASRRARVTRLCLLNRVGRALSVTTVQLNATTSILVQDQINQLPHVHPLLLERAESIVSEFPEVEKAMEERFDPGTSARFSRMSSVIDYYSRYKIDMAAMTELQEMMNDTDKELRLEAEKELKLLIPGLFKSITMLQKRLLPQLKYSEKPAVIELRPGVGGSEAALFTEDLMQMYINFANFNKWRHTIISKSDGSNGFLNEAIILIDSPEAYDTLRHESGVHRVQRIPATESKGRIHTSTAAVVVLPKMSEGDESSLKEDERAFAPGEVRIDTMRAGGKGGQHVNTTDSAVRLVHIPTGIMVLQQTERSQPQNKARAFAILRARLAERERQEELQRQRQMRTDQVTTTDRSDKIRTYNYPQNRVTDHRCLFSLHDLQGCMDGSRLNEVIDQVSAYEVEQRLQALAKPKSL